MDREAWRVIVRGVAKGRTQTCRLNQHHHTAPVKPSPQSELPTEKFSHSLKVERCFIRWAFLGLQAPEAASQVAPSKLLQGAGGRSQVI